MDTFEERVCDSATLLYLAAQADRLQFNRRVMTELLMEEIDLDGLHVLKVIVPFHRASFGPSVEPIWPDHHRCFVLCKVKGKTEPVQFQLDVEASRFDQLKTGSWVREAMEDPIRMGIAFARANAGNEEDE